MFDNNTQDTGHNSRNLKRPWKNVSFLYKTPDASDSGNHCLYDAHVSLTLCGSDHTRWVCYAFADTTFHTEDHNEDNEDEIEEDPIASDSENYGLRADTPIWDPREYFLTTVNYRMRQILEEWACLVREVERRIEKHVRHILPAEPF